jgi:flavodoxin
MKTAIIFYSLDGNCAFIAEEIKSQLNADLLRLHLKDEKKRGKIAGFFWSLGLMLSCKNPPLKAYTFDPSVYDLIIIGAPVWAFSPAPPLKTFFSQVSIKGKKIALFVCHGGGMGKALEKFKIKLAGNEIIAETDFKEPIKGNKEEVKKQLADWVKTLS